MNVKPLSKEMLSLSYILDNFKISDIDYGRFIYSILKYCYEKNIITSVWSRITDLDLNNLTLKFEYHNHDKPFFFRYDELCSSIISHVTFSAEIKPCTNKIYTIDLEVYSNRMLKKFCLSHRIDILSFAMFKILDAIDYLNEYNVSKEDMCTLDINLHDLFK